jgi:hypothetical protein
VVALWNCQALTGADHALLNGQPNILITDVHHNKMRSGFVCAYTDYYVQPCSTIAAWREQSRANLARLKDKLSLFSKAYLFGTGPSLSRAPEYDVGDGVRIVCNTIVKNTALLDHIRPNLIIAADADFHYGCSRYADQFRRDLLAGIERTGAMFACPEVHVPLMLHHFPDLARRIIGVPVVGGRLNLDLTEAFWVAARDNVLVQFLIPLGCTLARQIHLLGFDGKKPGDQKFGSHDPARQYGPLLKTVEQCHPAFFDFRNRAPGMPYAHPTVEHFAPLFVTVGAAIAPTAAPTFTIDGYWYGLARRSFEVR